MDALYRFEARFTALVPIGPVADGFRLDAHFEGRVVEGDFSGATISGIDYLRFRPDGTGVLDVREVVSLEGRCIEVQAGGYLIPPAGFALPSVEIMRSGDFEWPEVDLPVYGFASFRTAEEEWQYLNTAVGIFNGAANPGAGTVVIEAETLVPRTIAAAAGA